MSTPPAGLLASLVLGPLQFDRPWWLFLLAPLAALVLWWGRSSLSGMATGSRRAALVLRLVVVALLVGALAEPQRRRVAEDVAVTFVLDSSRSVAVDAQTRAERYVRDVSSQHKRGDDRLGTVTAAREAYVQDLPSRLVAEAQRRQIGVTDATDLASAVRLALAVRPEDAAYRLVLVSDGNETTGSLLSAAATARAAGVPIDVLPVEYEIEREVVVRSLSAPSTARVGEPIAVRVLLESTTRTRGELTLLVDGKPLDLNAGGPGFSLPIELEPGPNVRVLSLEVPPGPMMDFRAVFVPEPAAGGVAQSGDTIEENNSAAAVTSVGGRGRIMIVSESVDEAAPLVAALGRAQMVPEVRPADLMPQNLQDLSVFDALILINQRADRFSLATQEELKRYIRDAGGGLLMVGGPESFGAGGWIGSPLEEALPVRLDPPAKRQMPRGALVLVVHSIEMPDGVTYGKRTARAAIDSLSRLDLAGIVEFSGFGTGERWVHPIAEVGDGTAIRQSIENLAFGDMPSFAPSIEMALAGLEGVNAGAKHVIVISDGDPSLPPLRVLQRYRKSRITISTVGVYPHTPQDLATMAQMSQQTGGRHYNITTQAGLAQIVQIFIKEAQTVRRSLIWEGEPFSPARTPVAAEGLRGLGNLPPIRGYIVTADRDGPALVTLRGKENDPVLAQWQFGLGRAVTFASDSTSRWCAGWLQWPGFDAFWQQHVRWAMRPGSSANVRVLAEEQGENTRLVIRAVGDQGERLNFASFQGRVTGPDGKGLDIQVREVGGGNYEATLPTPLAGAYLSTLRYAAPRPGGGPPLEGSVQAAIIRPAGQEFRALTDNAALLRQVAELTGGQWLQGQTAQDNPWRREGLVMPVSTRRAWPIFLLAAVAIFLADVGVRRVRIDVPGIARAVRRSLSRAKGPASGPLADLHRARQTAREKISQRTASTAGAARARSPDSPGSGLPAANPPEGDLSGVKFQAPDGTAGDLRQDHVSGRPAAAATPSPAKPAPAAEEAGLSRLMKAKKRAQEDMQDNQ